MVRVTAMTPQAPEKFLDMIGDIWAEKTERETKRKRK
jgi:hypothetical protein